MLPLKSQWNQNFFTNISHRSPEQNNTTLLDDFKVHPEEIKMSIFLNNYQLKTNLKRKTCFKNPDRPTCNDLILTNYWQSFDVTCTPEIRLGNFKNWLILIWNCNFPNENHTFKPSETIQVSKIIYLNRNLTMCHQNMICVT